MDREAHEAQERAIAATVIAFVLISLGWITAGKPHTVPAAAACWFMHMSAFVVVSYAWKKAGDALKGDP